MKRTLLFVFALALLGVALTAVARKETRPSPWEQSASPKYIKFSHAFHVGEAGIACVDCHKAAATSRQASDNLRAGHDDCTTCHEEQIGNKCDYCHKNPDNIEAVPVQARTILFSHEQHLAMKGVECVTCHPGLDKVEYAGPANMPSMTTCTACHNDVKAPNVCEACHTTVTTLIPQSHLVSNFKKEHRYLARIGGLDVGCAMCHTENFCADCHSSAGLMGIGIKDLMVDPAPRGTPSVTPNNLRVQMAHGLNYRYTHGIDAKAKSADCATCHAVQEFCVQCHAAGGNITQGSFKPSWHFGPDFTRLGVGSGGGRHAELARRDIENCMTCHDIQGGDPTCILCHTDADGIKGTNPRTHPGGFHSGDHGSWHEDGGATCYSCHTDMNAHPGGRKGVGFCGYCHH
jgi:hypothetical protein